VSLDTAAAATIQTARGGRVPSGAIAIVDIGSNSVRLVIYESLSRTPAVVHNEKAICAIGRNMVSSGRLSEEGIRSALEALARYRMLADAHHVEIREAVATAAARDAPNGRELIRRAEAAWGAPIRILSGEEEARIAAEGVIAGIPDAHGLAADLGGGSLDMVPVNTGNTGQPLTFPFGPLRLVDLAKGDCEEARRIVEKALAKEESLRNIGGGTLYAVGGAWRSFARLDMDERHYPLHVLHHYEIPRGRALKLAKIIAQMSRKQLERIRIVSRRRAEALPYGAIVLERLLMVTGLQRVVISAYGLREGILHMRLTRQERAKDPLIEFAAATNSRVSRAPGHAGELFHWMTALFPDETAELGRVRRAACLFSDVGWRRHPDDRAVGAFSQVVTAPFSATSHRIRVMIAAAVFHRYSGDEDFPPGVRVEGLLDETDSRLARRIGLAARLGFAVSGSAEGQLPNYVLSIENNRILLEMPRSRQAVAGEPVHKRLSALAQAFGRKGEVLIA